MVDNAWIGHAEELIISTHKFLLHWLNTKIGNKHSSTILMKLNLTFFTPFPFLGRLPAAINSLLSAGPLIACTQIQTQSPQTLALLLLTRNPSSDPPFWSLHCQSGTHLQGCIGSEHCTGQLRAWPHCPARRHELHSLEPELEDQCKMAWHNCCNLAELSRHDKLSVVSLKYSCSFLKLAHQDN